MSRKSAIRLAIAVVVLIALFYVITSLPWAIVFGNALYSLITLLVLMALLMFALFTLRRSGRRPKR